jgi:hypothetical protein
MTYDIYIDIDIDIYIDIDIDIDSSPGIRAFRHRGTQGVQFDAPPTLGVCTLYSILYTL